MQTFKQFLEAREIRDIPQNDILDILNYINDPIISVRFALYCAEDCFHLNNERTRGPAQQCIDLIRKWLRNPESVIKQELRSARSAAYITAAAGSIVSTTATWAASASAQAVEATAYTADAYTADAADAAVWANVSTADAAYAAYTAFAYASEHQYNTPEWDQIRDQKLQEYTNKLKGMTTTRSGPQTSIEPLKGYDNTHFSIMAALDSLEEIGEIGREHFVYQDDDGQWVFDLGHDNILRADSREELARLIHNDRYYLNALMRLYNANV